jgi:hypothetical protein
MVDVATGEASDKKPTPEEQGKNPAAVSLGRRGGGPGTPHKKVLISVKSGKTSSPHVRDLVGVVDREKAAIGLLITLQSPTRDMRTEAADAGFYQSPWGRHPRIQILTVEELLDRQEIRHAADPPKRHNLHPGTSCGNG